MYYGKNKTSRSRANGRRFVRRGYGRRKPWYKRRYNAMEIAGKAWEGVKYLRELLNVEYKYFDTAVSTSISSTATLSHLTAIGQGDTDVTRDGNTCRLKGLNIRHIMALNTLATSSNVRVIVFNWFDSTTPVAGNILANTGNTTSQLNIENSDKFHILYDKHYSMDNVGCKLLDYKKYIKLNQKLKFNSTTGNDFENNSIWALFISSEPTNTVGNNFSARVRFIDN